MLRNLCKDIKRTFALSQITRKPITRVSESVRVHRVNEQITNLNVKVSGEVQLMSHDPRFLETVARLLAEAASASTTLATVDTKRVN